MTKTTNISTLTKGLNSPIAKAWVAAEALKENSAQAIRDVLMNSGVQVDSDHLTMTHNETLNELAIAIQEVADKKPEHEAKLRATVSREAMNLPEFGAKYRRDEDGELILNKRGNPVVEEPGHRLGYSNKADGFKWKISAKKTGTKTLTALEAAVKIIQAQDISEAEQEIMATFLREKWAEVKAESDQISAGDPGVILGEAA